MYKEHFIEKIKKARLDCNMTQLEVSQELGIPQNTISRIENGKREPDIETIGKLIDFYEVSADWIFGTGKKRPLSHRDLSTFSTIR